MMKKAVAILGMIAMLSGCVMLRTRSALQAELQNVADCFFDAVSIMQNEPVEKGNLAVFLRDAKAKQKTKGKGDFALLRWDESGEHLRLSGGQKVFYRVAEQSHDDADTWSATFTTYEFFTKEPVPPARTTVSLWFGTPPE
jgi:hypothetical protein